MNYRLNILKEHNLGLKEIQKTIASVEPMPGAKEFFDELRSFTQVIISDTFEQFATPLMKKLGWPTIFCNSLEVAENGEITGYNQYNESVDASGYSSKVKVTLTVNVRYTNNTNHEEDFEQQFSAFQTYDSSKLLTEVQDQLITLMVKDIAEQIFNATVANW